MGHFSIELGSWEIDQLKALAEQLGYTQKTGPYTNMGSIRQMIIAIAHGRLLVTDNPDCEPQPYYDKAVCW